MPKSELVDMLVVKSDMFTLCAQFDPAATVHVSRAGEVGQVSFLSEQASLKLARSTSCLGV